MRLNKDGELDFTDEFKKAARELRWSDGKILDGLIPACGFRPDNPPPAEILGIAALLPNGDFILFTFNFSPEVIATIVVVLRFLPQYIVEAWLHTLLFPKASYFLGHLSYIYDTASGQNSS